MQTRTDNTLLIEESGELKRIVVKMKDGPRMYNVSLSGMKDFEEQLGGAETPVTRQFPVGFEVKE